MIEAELEDYEARINARSRVKVGAFDPGAHDDLLTALGLAVLEDLALPGRAASLAEIERIMMGAYADNPYADEASWATEPRWW